MQRPVAVGLLLCEQVIVEETTRNVTPVNCFTRRQVKELPTGPLPFVVFALLTDGQGEMPLQLRIERLDTYEDIYSRTVVVRFVEPLQTVRCMLRVTDCEFPIEGLYQATLLVENELVAQRVFAIIKQEGDS